MGRGSGGGKWLGVVMGVCWEGDVGDGFDGGTGIWKVVFVLRIWRRGKMVDKCKGNNGV